jgi:hypothetical protein
MAFLLLQLVIQPAPLLAESEVASDVMSSAGGETKSTEYWIKDTFGQGPIGAPATATGIQLRDGFWVTLSTFGAYDDTLPPGEVLALSATPSDQAVTLTWQNPSDADFQGTLIRYSTTGFPDAPDDGDLVGEFINVPGTSDEYTHSGLANGLTHYYTAFAFDPFMNFAPGVQDRATPFDGIPPGAVQDVSASSQDMSVKLIWTNPGDGDFAHTLVRYSTVGYPTSVGEGTPVENGSDGEFPNSPASVDSFTHSGLANTETYYYALFAADEVPNYSTAKTVKGNPQDEIPPSPVNYFEVISRIDGSLKLRWSNPDDEDFEGALVRYSTDDYPTVEGDGFAVENDNAGRFPGTPAAVDSFIHTERQDGVTYYYAVFAYDEVPNYAAGVTGSAVSDDDMGPTISVSVFQNPYVTNHLDVYLISSESVMDTSVYCSVASEQLDLEETDPLEHVWMGDYDLFSTGLISIYVRCRDTNSNLTELSRSFSSALILESDGGLATSVDGLFQVNIPGRSIARDSYFLIFDQADDRFELGTAYELSPSEIDLGDFVEVAVVYPEDTPEPEHLAVGVLNSGQVVPVESFIQQETNRIVAYVEDLGTYGLVRRPGILTPSLGRGGLVVLQNVPNPFAGSTTIAFEVTRAGRASVEIVGVDGRSVRYLYDQMVVPGRHSIVWDGTDANGDRAASGVYFYRVRFESKTVTKKMVHLR